MGVESFSGGRVGLVGIVGVSVGVGVALGGLTGVWEAVGIGEEGDGDGLAFGVDVSG